MDTAGYPVLIWLIWGWTSGFLIEFPSSDGMGFSSRDATQILGFEVNVEDGWTRVSSTCTHTEPYIHSSLSLSSSLALSLSSSLSLSLSPALSLSLSLSHAAHQSLAVRIASCRG